MLAALAFDHPVPVPTERVVTLVWGEDPPPTAHKACHNHIARLRQAWPGVVETLPSGYRLAPNVELDATELTGVVFGDRGEAGADELARLIKDSHGLLFEDLHPWPEVQERRERSRQAIEVLRERQVMALLAEQRDDAAALAAHELVEAAPDSEHRWWLWALALARVGRRREALAALADAHQRLVKAGLEFGPHLRALEHLVAQGDPLVDNPSLARHSVLAAPVHRSDEPVGMNEVLEDLDRWLDATDRARVLNLVGPAGSGKTTLAAALASSARRRGMVVATAGCAADPTAPLQPIVDVLEAVEGRSSDGPTGPDRTASDLTTRFTDGDRTPQHRDLIEAVRAAFETLPDHPTVVIIEDVHWASPLTGQAIAAAADGVARGGSARLLITARTGEDHLREAPLPPERIEVLPVPPWDADSVEGWLRSYEPDPDRRAAAARWLVAQSGGRPLFVRELALGLVGEDRLGPGARGDFTPPKDAPPAVMSALSARLNRMSTLATHVIEVAAVIGSQVPLAVLEAVAGVSPAGVEELRRRGVLLDHDPDPATLVFEHELMRSAALDRLGPVAAAELHHLVLEAWDRAGELSIEARAHHAVAAASLDADRAVAAADEAAAAAAAALDHEVAGDWWLTAALTLADRRPERELDRMEREMRAGEAFVRVGDPRCEAILLGAASRAADHREWDLAARAAAAVCRLGPTSTVGRPHPEVAELCDRLLHRIESPRTRASLAAATTMIHSMAGEFDRCRELFGRAQADAEMDGSDEALIDVLPFAYMTLSDPGDLEQREAISDRLAQASTRAGRPDGLWSALHLRFSNQLQRGDPALRRTAASLVALSDRVRERPREWEVGYVQAVVSFLDGDLDRAEAEIEDTLQFVDTVAESRVMAAYGAQLLAIRLVQNRLGELVDTVHQLADDQPTVGAWRAALALAAAQAGRRDLAAEAFDAVVETGTVRLPRDYAYTGALVALAEAAALLGDPARARVVLPFLEPWSGRWSWVGTATLGPVDTPLARLLALTGDQERASAVGERALKAAQHMAAPVQIRLARASFPVPAPDLTVGY